MFHILLQHLARIIKVLVFQDEAADNSVSAALVPEHIDNGLFLLITPFPGTACIL